MFFIMAFKSGSLSPLPDISAYVTCIGHLRYNIFIERRSSLRYQDTTWLVRRFRFFFSRFMCNFSIYLIFRWWVLKFIYLYQNFKVFVQRFCMQSSLAVSLFSLATHPVYDCTVLVCPMFMIHKLLLINEHIVATRSLLMMDTIMGWS